MRALEVTGSIDEEGKLSLDRPLDVKISGRVRIIVLFNESTVELEHDFDNSPIEFIRASVTRALQQAKAGQRIPLEEMWGGIDVK
jgi:hypothetical protein